jgi:prophage tail gpP-like protein
VPHAGLDVGDTVFKVLNEFAQNRGLLFWSQGNGSIVFGKAVGEGEPHYRIGSRQIKARTRVRDISGLHSKIIIVSDSDAGHQVATATNASAPIDIPFAAAYNGHDSAGLKKQAAEFTRQEKLQLFSMDCTVKGFSCDGKNWSVNTRVHVDDEVAGFADTLLVRTREFLFDKTNGSTTKLSLSPILAEDVFKAYPKQKKGRDSW